MLKRIFKKKFTFDHSFEKQGVAFRLKGKDGKRYNLPLPKSVMDDLYNWAPLEYRALCQFSNIAESLKDVKFDEKLISEFKDVYSKE